MTPLQHALPATHSVRLRAFARGRNVALLAALCLLVAAPAGAKKHRARRHLTLEQRINQILHDSGAERGFWGILVMRLEDGKVLYSRNPDHLYMPASNMKLFTTAAALEKLGADYVFKTTVEALAPPASDGTVGDLYLVGRGDPNLSDRVLPFNPDLERQGPADAAFDDLAEQVMRRGVREVRGDLVADDTYFVYEPFAHDWAADDLVWGYGAPVTALAFHDNEFLFNIMPASAVGDPAVISLDPATDYYEINNHVVTGDSNAEESIRVERLPGSKRLDVWGEVPLGTISHQDALAIENPAELAARLLAGALARRGIDVRGRVRVERRTTTDAAEEIEAVSSDPRDHPSVPSSNEEGNPPPKAREGWLQNKTSESQGKPSRAVLAEHDSLPLKEDVKVILKVSQNLHAEMLLRTLGRGAGRCGCIEGGLDVLKDYLDEVGIGPDQYHFADGSGLSRDDLVAPRAIVKLLEHMARSPNFEVFEGALPVAGEDGTLADRFGDSPANGRIHAKTGTIEHTNALSGYFLGAPKGRVIFSIIGNSHTLSHNDGARVVDQIAEAIFERYGSRR